MKTNAVHHRWVDIPSEQINESIARRFITGDSVTVGRFELKQGGVVPSHSHANEQISIVLSGVLLFKIDGRETVVKAGEVMQIPGNVAHEVESARGHARRRRVQPGASGLDRQDRHVLQTVGAGGWGLDWDS